MSRPSTLKDPHEPSPTPLDPDRPQGVPSPFTQAGATALLASVSQGFLHNAPGGVSRLMALRNVLVKPLGLRTSPLGCPVSSLLSPNTVSCLPSVSRCWTSV